MRKFRVIEVPFQPFLASDAGSVLMQNWFFRCRPNMAHMRQSRLDSGLVCQVKVLKNIKTFPLRLAADFCL